MSRHSGGPGRPERPLAGDIRRQPAPTPAAESPLRRLESNDAVALTFDDGPDPDYTPAVLDLLAAAQVPATFFLIAREALRHPGLVRRIVAEGHTLGNHGWSHRHPWLQSAAGARRELRDGAVALTQLAGVAVRWYRPPHGRLRPCLRLASAAQGQQVALWSKSAIDWGIWADAARVARRLARVQAGDIVLMHDGRNRHNRPAVTLQALPALLADLRQRGLRAVRL